MDERVFGKVVAGQIVLPESGRLGTRELLDLITEALCPALEAKAGLHAIVGKLWPTEGGGQMPMELSPGDIAFLDEIVPKLPPISVRSDALALERFISAYREHPARKNWEPRVADPWDVDRNRAARAEIRQQHDEALSRLALSGGIRVITFLGQPVDQFRHNCYVSMVDVNRYLDPLGILAPSKRPAASRSTPRRSEQEFSKVQIAAMRAYEDQYGREAMRKKFRIGAETATRLLGLTPKGQKRVATNERRALTSWIPLRAVASNVDSGTED